MKKIPICLCIPLIAWCGWISWKINAMEADHSFNQKISHLNHTKNLEEDVMIMTSFQERLDAHEEGLLMLSKTADTHTKRLNAHEQCIQMLNHRRN